jgi:RNA polymerase sigma factor (sigma-70 family)
MTSKPHAFIVDDDEPVRRSLQRLLEAANIPVKLFPSASAFLEWFDRDASGCLILDVRMPGIGGLDLQEQLNREQIDIPIIMISGHGDISMAVRAVKKGALDFLEKPFRSEQLIGRIREAFDIDAQRRAQRQERMAVLAKLDRLTPRESEVMPLLAEGNSVKEVAALLGLSHKTVQVHRAHILEKLEATSDVNLVSFAQLQKEEARRRTETPNHPRAANH